jgi:hypothetical protein
VEVLFLYGLDLNKGVAGKVFPRPEGIPLGHCRGGSAGTRRFPRAQIAEGDRAVKVLAPQRTK